MSCVIVTLDQRLKDCVEANGGLKYLSMIKLSEFVSATVTAKKVAAFTISGSFIPFYPDNDKTSTLTAVTERPNQFVSFKTIDGLISFAGPTEDDQVAANDIDCCNIMAVVFTKSGLNFVIGKQLNQAKDDLEDPTVVLKVNADTIVPPGDDATRIEYKFVGQQKNLPPYTGTPASVGITP